MSRLGRDLAPGLLPRDSLLMGLVGVTVGLTLTIAYLLGFLSIRGVFLLFTAIFLGWLFLAHPEALLLGVMIAYFGSTYLFENLMVQGLARGISLALAGVVLVLNLGVKKKFTRVSTSLDYLILLWLGVVLISFIYGFYFQGNDLKYLTGDLYKFLEIFVAFVLVTFIVRRERQVKFLTWGFLMVALVFAVVDSALFFRLAYRIADVILARVREASQFLSVFALVLALSMILHERRTKVKIALVFLFCAFFFSFALTFLRTGYIAIPPTVAFVLLLYLGKSKKFLFRGLAKFTVLAIILLAALVLFNLGLTAINPDMDIIKGTAVRFHSLIDPFSEDPVSISVRILEIKSIISQILVPYPLLGKGLGGEYYTATNVPEGIEWGMKHYVHNNYFDFLIRTGILGLAIFLVVAFKYFRDAVKIYLRSENSFHQGLVLGCLGIFVSSCIMALSASILYSPFLFITMALVYSVASIEEKNVTGPENLG